MLIQKTRVIFPRAENLITEAWSQHGIGIKQQFRVRKGPLDGFVSQVWDFGEFDSVLNVFKISILNAADERLSR